MKIKLFLTLATLLLSGTSVLAQSNAAGSGAVGGQVPKMKVAIVDSDAFKERIGELKIKYDKLRTEFSSQAQQLQSMQAKLSAQQQTLQEGKNLTPQQAQKLSEDIEQQKKLYDRTLEDTQAAADKRQKEETEAILQKLTKFLNDYCTKNGITAVFDLRRSLETQLVVYWAEGANITEDFIKEYNKANPSAAAAAPATSPAKP
ncbi:MAG: OmpH family outer membrane protein [Blastocatellia bacterium]|nr:OmpH family outer membrane protein [Blastocatellia bacterium]